MQSVTRTVPVSVSNSVSSTSESGRYQRLVETTDAGASVGAMLPEPVTLVSEQAGEAGTGVEMGQAEPVD